MSELKFAPSILSADFAALGEAAARAEEAGADWLHVDVMDGQFVPDLTFGPKMVEDLAKRTRLPLDVHLMILRPEEWARRYAEAGAACVTVHVEASRDPRSAIEAIRGRGVKAGLAISPGTPVSSLVPYLDGLDLALVMSVRPGRGGQAFIESALDRVREVRAALEAKGLSGVELEVDGGIKAGNARRVAEAGASVLVAGSAIYLDPAGPTAALRALRAAVAGGGSVR